MAAVTRKIGLSLGADLCWPLCYEEIVRRMSPRVRIGGDDVRFEVERVTIEPFSLRSPKRYDLVIDRLVHWYRTSREWIKKIIVMDGVYVFNNPWTFQAMEKQTSYCAMMHLGMPVPETWLVPPKEYEESPDLEPTLARYARLFDLDDIGERIGYPLYMKPYDGGAWRGVSRIESGEDLKKAYDESGRLIMHLQKAVEPWDVFVRCIGVGPQVRVVRYDPSAPMHDRYVVGEPELPQAEIDHLRATTLTINSFFGWDFNSCEAMRGTIDGVWHPIDFANACPDSQITSLHYHFPWLVKAKIRWSLYCAATGRRMRLNPDWEPFYAVAAEDVPYEDKLERYARIARESLEAERFEEFCAKHLADLDEVAWEYFGGDHAKDAFRAKVEAVHPEEEWDEYTDLFWGRVQEWREREARPAAERK